MAGYSEAAAWAMLIPIVAIIGGFTLAGLGIYAQIRRREFEHRERLAMIEKGVSPPAAPDSGAREGTSLNPFDRAIGESHEDRAVRTRRGGFILMAIAVGIGFLIWMTDRDVGDAAGIGGFLLILGAAIFVSSYFGRPRGGEPGPPSRSGR